MQQNYTIVLRQCKEGYVSLCLELMVTGYGETREKSLESIRDAIASYIDSQEEGMDLTRSVPLDLLHDFLSEEEEGVQAMPAMKVLAYA
jgi:predicted RNase H-like HicB family nuclease